MYGEIPRRSSQAPISLTGSSTATSERISLPSHLPQTHSSLSDPRNPELRKEPKWKDRNCRGCGEIISNTKALVCKKCREANAQARSKREGARRDAVAATSPYYCRKCNRHKTASDFGRKYSGEQLKICRKCLDKDRRNAGFKKDALRQDQDNNESSLAQGHGGPSTGIVQQKYHGEPMKVNQPPSQPGPEGDSSEPMAVDQPSTDLTQEEGHGEAREIGHLPTEVAQEGSDGDASITDDPRPPTSLRETLFVRSCDPLRRLVQEMRIVLDTMSNEEDTCQAGYREFLRHFDAPSSQGAALLAKMATFDPGYFTHKLRDNVPIGDFEIINKNDTGGCLVLYATLEQLKAARSGQGVPDVYYIVVAETHPSECSDRSNKFLEQLERTFWDCEVEYQQYLQSAIDTPPTERMLVGKVLEMAKEMKHSPETGRPYAEKQPPFNFLNLSGEKLTDSFTQSKLVEILGLDQLSHLTHRTLISQSKLSKPNISNELDKAASSHNVVVDGNSCGKFELLGFPGTISSWHMDVMGMTWIQTLSEHKAWCIVDTPDNDELWDDFKEHGVGWKPKLGTVKVIPLSAGDTLLMMPGKFNAHMPISFGDSFTHMIGGQVWPRDPSYLKGLLRSLSYVIEHNDVVTNELPPRQLPALINSLREEIALSLQGTQSTISSGSRNTPEYEQHHLDQLDEWKERMTSHLACQCPGGKCQSTSEETQCPCHSRDQKFADKVKHQGGCTAWCHEGVCRKGKPSAKSRRKR
ncbi:hypothetical protein HBH98_233200 [Parastagonospora nodorum]|nr:hypothetical protein HBH46_211080 [Parastagonospora nodorum]KAH4112705.1 hypothetical protein HBH47_221480 [Parastagonospora nodorum]KAH4335600.1 hypothetical protein HBH98_233200 [Parastagonospora nodorum]KAH4356374.1 hypothetical protein HBH97_232310 [Parastagonospora nodorum]KAH4371984.1 hypothetical protein HBH99_234500 [Parastagonospora nodorum]